MKIFLNKILYFFSKLDTSVLFFLIFVFCLPFFKKINIYSDFSFLDGRFVDYLTYSVYGFDFLLLGVFVSWIFEIIFKKEEPIMIKPMVGLSYLGIIIFSIISIFFSTDKLISLYYIFVLIILAALFVFIINKLRNKNNLFLFLNTFIAAASIQSILAIVQFLKNGSIGLSILGEQVISPKIAGVAKIMFSSIKHIRPYGTFSHPNILALFLVIAGIIAIYLILNYKYKAYRITLIISFLLIAFALFLTFSRVLWILGGITWVLMFLKYYGFSFKKIRKAWPYLLFVFILISLSLFFFYPAIAWRVNPFNPIFWQSFNDRALIFGKAWIMAKSHFMGIGIGNFVIEEAYLLTGYPLWMAEPVHNTYFLVLAEIGWFGLFCFLSLIYFLIGKIRNIPTYLKYIFFTITIYMFFDHCFWDLRQAQILAAIFFAIIYLHHFKADRDSE